MNKYKHRDRWIMALKILSPAGFRSFGVAVTTLMTFLLFCTVNLAAQFTFVGTYGNSAYNEGVKALVMNDSTYMIIGNTAGPSQTSTPYFALIDHQGALLRDWIIPQSQLVVVTSAQLFDSIIWITGYTYHQGIYDNMLMRMSTSGQLLTEVYWGNGGWNFPRAMLVTHQDTVYIAGEQTDTLFGAKRGVLWCLSGGGSVHWHSTYGGLGEDALLAIDTGHGQTLIMAGYTKSFGSYLDSALWILQTDRQGQVIWETVEDYPGSDMATGIRADIQGGYILCGQSEYWTDYGREAFIMYLDSAGTPQWKTRLGSEDEAAFYAIIQRPDSSYRMAGFYSGAMSLGKKEFYMQNCQSNGWWGPLLGGFIHGGKDDDVAVDLIATPDGGYLVTGTTRSFGPGISHIMVMKSDSVGTVLTNLGHQTGINDHVHPNHDFAVFPNPAKEAMKIKLQSGRAGMHQMVTIMSSSGLVVMQTDLRIPEDHTIHLNISHLAPGIYVIQLGNQHQKFIKL